MVAGAAVGACAVIAGILALTVGGAPSSPSADGRSAATASTTVTSHDSTLVESIAAYPSDDAARLLGALPAALAGCAPQTPPGFSQYPQTIKVTTKAGPSLGNGTLLIDGIITTHRHWHGRHYPARAKK